MRVFLARTAALLLAIVLWVWFIFKFSVDWIGRTTVIDDFNQLVERMPMILGWLIATPWWVPGGLASLLTAFLLWAGWPADQGGGRLSRKQRQRAALGFRALQVAEKIAYFQRVGQWAGGDAILGSEIFAVMVRFHDMGFPIPEIPDNVSQEERLTEAFKYLSVMGVLLRDGSIKEATMTSREMYLQSLKRSKGA